MKCSFLSRDLPNEIRAFWCPLPLRFGGGLACLGAGMLNSLESFFLGCSLGSREPPRAPSPGPGERGLWRDGDLGGGVGQGCAFAPAVLFRVRGLREPSQNGPAEREGGGISGGRGVCILGAA